MAVGLQFGTRGTGGQDPIRLRVLERARRVADQKVGVGERTAGGDEIGDEPALGVDALLAPRRVLNRLDLRDVNAVGQRPLHGNQIPQNAGPVGRRCSWCIRIQACVTMS